MSALRLLKNLLRTENDQENSSEPVPDEKSPDDQVPILSNSDSNQQNLIILSDSLQPVNTATNKVGKSNFQLVHEESGLDDPLAAAEYAEAKKIIDAIKHEVTLAEAQEYQQGRQYLTQLMAEVQEMEQERELAYKYGRAVIAKLEAEFTEEREEEEKEKELEYKYAIAEKIKLAEEVEREERKQYYRAKRIMTRIKREVAHEERHKQRKQQRQAQAIAQRRSLDDSDFSFEESYTSNPSDTFSDESDNTVERADTSDARQGADSDTKCTGLDDIGLKLTDE